MTRFRIALGVVAVVCGTLGGALANAQTVGDAPRRKIDPAEASYQFNEAWRRDQIARQIDLNYRMQWMAGFGPQLVGPFEPWPRVPGDIWGYPQARPIVHPIGHESAQTGPNRWIYRPIYATPSPAAPAAAPPDVVQPPQAGVQLPAPSDADGPPQNGRPQRRAF